MDFCSVVGIVAEYNPFHRGHRYQLDQVRQALGPVPVVAVMSGSLT
ncbi:nucleotidyltransferase family protein, partial [Acidaminococcus timonensis]